MSEQILERTINGNGMPMQATLESDSEVAPTGHRTFLIVALAIVGGLVLGGLALFMMPPAADEEALAAVPPTSAAGAAAGAAEAAPKAAEAAAVEAAAAAAEEAAAEEVVVQKTKARITSRDPFAPLVAKAAPAPAAAAAPAAAPAADEASSAESSSSTSSAASGATISALKVSPLADSVTLKLDGKKYSVDEGESFAKSYRLYDIFNANCAGFLYGDQNAVVCEGDSVQIG